jgi:hypothetical protein
MMKVRVHINRDWRGGHRLLLVTDKGRGKIDVLTDFVWAEYDEGALFDLNAGIPGASEMIQQIVDRAWEAGFRPSGFGDVKNETAAIREHLSDMKAIAFHQLKIKPD